MRRLTSRHSAAARAELVTPPHAILLPLADAAAGSAQRRRRRRRDAAPRPPPPFPGAGRRRPASPFTALVPQSVRLRLCTRAHDCVRGDPAEVVSQQLRCVDWTLQSTPPRSGVISGHWGTRPAAGVGRSASRPDRRRTPPVLCSASVWFMCTAITWVSK